MYSRKENTVNQLWCSVIQWCPTFCNPRDHPTSQSMKFSRQEYWTGLPFPPPGYLPDPGIEPMFLASSALVGGFFTTSAPWEALKSTILQ